MKCYICIDQGNTLIHDKNCQYVVKAIGLVLIAFFLYKNILDG